MGALATPRLSSLARGKARDRALRESEERCELCSRPIGDDHRHVLDLDSGALMCACRPCSTLLDGPAAGGGHFKLVPDRRLRLVDFELPDRTWDELRIPVDMAFLFRSSREERIRAFYPSPMGPTESLLGLDAWAGIERANPVLRGMRDDVEALLVNRARGARRSWIVPIEDCFGLVAVIRTRWRGFTGGAEVWQEIDNFFERLDARATPSSGKEGTWRT